MGHAHRSVKDPATIQTAPCAVNFALIPSSLGVLLGQWLRRYINEDVFRKTLAVVLFLIGLNLIRRAFSWKVKSMNAKGAKDFFSIPP